MTPRLQSLETPLLRAVRELFDRQADQLPELKVPIKAYLAGGVAVHFWRGTRVTSDVDAEFSLAGTGYRHFLPIEDVLGYTDSDGTRRAVHIDRNYSPVFALAHEDYVDRAFEVGSALGGKGKLDVFVLAPIDLAISKLARWSPHDKEDVYGLAEDGLITADELGALATEAARTAVGHNPDLLRINILEAVDHVRAQQPTRPRL